MRRNSHNSSGAIISEDIIRNPNRNFFAVSWIDGFDSFEFYAGLFFLGISALYLGLEFGLNNISFDFFGVLNMRQKFSDQSMLRSEDNIRYAK